MKKLLLLLLFISAFSCRKNDPALPSRYTPFLHLTYELIQQRTTCETDSAYLSAAESLYNKYQMNQKEFDRTMIFFNEHPEAWSIFFEELTTLQTDSGAIYFD